MRFYQTSSQPQYKTGGRYHGEWQENMKHGYGTRSWVNGNKYEGVRNREKNTGQERHPRVPPGLFDFDQALTASGRGRVSTRSCFEPLRELHRIADFCFGVSYVECTSISSLFSKQSVCLY